MVTITLAASQSAPDSRLVFRVPQTAVLLAGSRNGFVDRQEADRIVSSLSDAGFSFLVGCAPGIDECFRRALAAREEGEASTFVACAFADRVRANESLGLFASVVVPQGLSPAAALHRRTLWMVKRAELLILFPDNPVRGHWGKGSRLAFTAALFKVKPVFVVTAKRPADSPHYHVIPDSLYGVVDGYWAVPHPTEFGTCDEVV
jgi:hypothetical protein